MNYLLELDKNILFAIVFSRIFLIACWCFFLTIIAKKNLPSYLLYSVVFIGSFSIIADMALLKSGYALWPNGSGDRFAYLSHAMTYAVGNPFGEDPFYKNIPAMLSPLFPYLAALFHQLTHISIIKIYDFSSLLWVVLIPAAFYLFRPSVIDGENKKDKQWETILMACFALYLSSDIQDLRFFREDFWNLLVLHKPSHSFSFICIPILFYFLSKSPSFSNTLISGMILAVMISSWPVTGVFLMCSLIPYLLIIFIRKKEKFLGVLIQIIAAIILATTLSSWYWLRFFLSNDISPQGALTVSNYEKYDNVIFDPFEATFFMLPLFWLGGMGLYTMYKRNTKWDLHYFSFTLSLYLGKFVAYPLCRWFFNFGSQAFECSVFFIRFAMGIAAGIGFYALIKHLTSKTISESYSNKENSTHKVDAFFKRLSTIRRFNFTNHSTWIALGLLLLTPYMIIFWEIPALNSKWYAGLNTIPKSMIEYTDWIKQYTPRDSVFLSDSHTAMWTAALTGRKLMIDRGGTWHFKINFQNRKKMANKILSAKEFNEDLIQTIKQYHLSHIVVTERLKKEYPDIFIDKFNKQKYLSQKTYDNKEYIIYQLNIENFK